MTATTAIAPGLYYEVAPPPAAPEPLRSDIAAFVGRTRRGPIGAPIRVEGWRAYIGVFGDLVVAADTPYGIRGYFENGGQLAWIVRLPDDPLVVGLAAAALVFDASWGTALDRYWIAATSPGAWSDGARIELDWYIDPTQGVPVFDVTVSTAGDGVEQLAGIPAAALVDEVARRSRLIRILPDPAAGVPASGPPRPRRRSLVQGLALAPVASWPAWLRARMLPAEPASLDALAWYLDAIDQLTDQPEVALLALPDLYNDFAAPAWAPGGAVGAVLAAAIAAADELRDRMVLVDLPPSNAPATAIELVRWLDGLGRGDGTHIWRAAAAYHPPIRVLDPLGGLGHELRRIAPSGHVAGMISQSDRLRGAHQTPANVALVDVVDVTEERPTDELAVLGGGGVNMIRCAPRRGFVVMGGRTLDLVEGYRFVAHRRLLHRLVRAIHLAAQPLVFETNGPELWVRFARAVTSVILPAWRAGALKGTTAGQAFRVQCDADTNPQREIDLGRCVCLIAFAPATPMEFILLRVAVSRDGSLEVLT